MTSALAGTYPASTVPLRVIGEQMAVVLADIHRLEGSGLRQVPLESPTGEGRLATCARSEWNRLDFSELELTHSDFWCGNALWEGGALIGVVDWSGAQHAPRGLDVAWCRQDLVLLGSPSAADHFLHEYEEHARTAIAEFHAWDLQAAARADPIVDTWAPNYQGIDRTELTAGVLRRRFDDWVSALTA